MLWGFPRVGLSKKWGGAVYRMDWVHSDHYLCVCAPCWIAIYILYRAANMSITMLLNIQPSSKPSSTNKNPSYSVTATALISASLHEKCGASVPGRLNNAPPGQIANVAPVPSSNTTFPRLCAADSTLNLAPAAVPGWSPTHV